MSLRKVAFVDRDGTIIEEPESHEGDQLGHFKSGGIYQQHRDVVNDKCRRTG